MEPQREQSTVEVAIGMARALAAATVDNARVDNVDDDTAAIDEQQSLEEEEEEDDLTQKDEDDDEEAEQSGAQQEEGDNLRRFESLEGAEGLRMLSSGSRDESSSSSSSSSSSTGSYSNYSRSYGSGAALVAAPTAAEAGSIRIVSDRPEEIHIMLDEGRILVERCRLSF